jgi:hypothetical protein
MYNMVGASDMFGQQSQNRVRPWEKTNQVAALYGYQHRHPKNVEELVREKLSETMYSSSDGRVSRESILQ